ncbi:MAG: hypothetical protein ABW000_07330 [Actinoplanes sp.]
MSLQPQSFPVSHILDSEVARHVAVGWAVESRSDTMAVVVSTAKPNHVLHLLLTLVTCGLWAVVWFVIAVTSKTRRVSLVLNPDGTVTRTQY